MAPPEHPPAASLDALVIVENVRKHVPFEWHTLEREYGAEAIVRQIVRILREAPNGDLERTLQRIDESRKKIEPKDEFLRAFRCVITQALCECAARIEQGKTRV